MNQFASGNKRNYYGKGDVIVYRLHRDCRVPEGACPVFGANVMLLIYGDAFWPTYATGDNTGLIATDSMKNFIQRETLNYPGFDLEGYCRFLCEKFLSTYPQTDGAQVSATEVPYSGVGKSGVSFVPGRQDRAFARVEMRREGGQLVLEELRSGIRGYRLLRLGGSAFQGFVRDQYTTLPDIHNRPLHMWLDLEWTYADPRAGFQEPEIVGRVREIVTEVFDAFNSGSIQQVIYQVGSRILEEIPTVEQIELEANNRTWDTIVDEGETIGVYTDARPPFGCLGLTMRR